MLVNSNPATIMTDPETADRTYVEPLTVESVTAIIRRERPDALLPTVGGQTALNLAMALDEAGVLEEFGVEMIGAKREAISVAEDRELFKRAMEEEGLPMPRGGFAHTWAEAEKIVEETGYPAIIRPSFTLGGTGGGIAYNPEEFEEIVRGGLAASPVSQVLIEESILGWKEFELEVMRDLADNVVIICSIENFDPMGVHTGDSITVAPAQTLTDVEYQRLARHVHPRHPQGRRRDRRLEHPVRRQPRERRRARHRDEPARLALFGAGVEGDRLPHREDRGQARRRLHARRDRQRHHEEDARLLRADD